MIEVKVEFLGTFSSELDELDRQIELVDGATVGDLVDHLTRTLPKGERFRGWCWTSRGTSRDTCFSW